MNNPTISKIRIYPIKSLGFVELEEAEIGVHSIKNDRLFAMVDTNGRYVNGKRTHLVNLLKTEFDLANGLVKFSDKKNSEKNSFELKEGNQELDNYLSNFFGIKLHLKRNENGKFMDIPMESSVTVVSQASLQYLQKDLQRHDLENMRLRFRSNIELTAVEAFWEDRLYQQPGIGVRFKMGDVEMIGISPRARCNVPPQNPHTGEMDYHFVKNMMKSRDGHIDTAEKILQYGRASYFLTANVFVPKSEIGKKIKLNNPIEILGPIKFI